MLISALALIEQEMTYSVPVVIGALAFWNCAWFDPTVASPNPQDRVTGFVKHKKHPEMDDPPLNEHVSTKPWLTTRLENEAIHIMLTGS